LKVKNKKEQIKKPRVSKLISRGERDDLRVELTVSAQGAQAPDPQGKNDYE